MDQFPEIVRRVAATNELMVYAVIFVGVLTFLGLVVAVLGVYRANLQHRQALEIMKEMRGASDRLGNCLFKKLGPVELP